MKRFSISIVAVILCIAVIAVAIVAASTNGSSDNSPADYTTSTAESTENATPPITNTPTSSNAPTSNATFTYFEDSRIQNGNLTKLVLSINATLTDGDTFEIDCSKFYLYVWIEGQNGAKSLLNLHHYTCLESGIRYLDAVDTTTEIKLTFVFPSEAMGFDGYMVPFSTYTLSYFGQQVTHKN
jgi:hypothetical protein